MRNQPFPSPSRCRLQRAHTAWLVTILACLGINPTLDDHLLQCNIACLPALSLETLDLLLETADLQPLLNHLNIGYEQAAAVLFLAWSSAIATCF
jgi:hypothetical protein